MRDLKKGKMWVLLCAVMFLTVGCGEKDASEKLEENANEMKSNAEEALDEMDGEGALQEAAEDIESFGEKTKESFQDFGDEVKEKFNDMKLEKRVDDIVAETKAELEQARDATGESAEDLEQKVKEITGKSKKKIQALVDSVKSE